jgi:predicted MFS family arabinose efflux permease
MNKRIIVKQEVINSFRALKHQNFRYFWIGQCISLLGTWIQRTSQLWLVYNITRSPFLLGILGVFQFGPMLLFSLFAGTLVDRFSKKKVLILTQAVLMLQAFVLAFLVWTGHVQYWHILILAAIMGFVNTLDMPTRQSFIIELVGKEDLMSAVALNSAIVNIAKIIGPALSGIVIISLGMSSCFFLNGVSFIAVIIGLYFIKTNPINIQKRNGKLLSEVLEGLKYIGSSKILLSAVFAMLAVGTFAMNSDVIIPVFAREVLHQQARTYGLLLSAMGIGSLIGAIIVSSRSKKSPTRKVLFISAICECLLYMIFGFVHSYFSAILFIALLGFFSVIFLTTANSIIQLNSDNDYRGRTMSVYTLAFAGTTPIGNFFAGSVTERFGANMGFLACGAVTIVLIAGILIRENKVSRVV